MESVDSVDGCANGGKFYVCETIINTHSEISLFWTALGQFGQAQVS